MGPSRCVRFVTAFLLAQVAVFFGGFMLICLVIYNRSGGEYGRFLRWGAVRGGEASSENDAGKWD